MPGTAQHLADARALIDAGLGRGQPRHARRFLQRRAFVRAAVQQREELAIDVEHDDVAAGDIDDLVATGRDLRDGRDDVTGHTVETLSELVDRAGISAEDLLSLGLRQRRLEGEARVVEIPVRIVRREQETIDADPFDQRAQVPGFVRFVDRLRREPEMLADIFRRLALEMRTSLRKRSKCWSIRHTADGIQPKPPSMKTNFNFGKRSGTPSITRLASCAAMVCAFDWCSST